VGFYFYSDLGAWSNTQLVSIIGCYLTIVSVVFAYFLLDEERGRETRQNR